MHIIAVKSKAFSALSSGIRERGQLIERAGTEDLLFGFLRAFVVWTGASVRGRRALQVFMEYIQFSFILKQSICVSQGC